MRALTDATLITLRKKDFVRCFGSEFSDKWVELFQFFRQMPVLSHISSPHVKVLAAGTTAVTFKPTDVVIDQGEPCTQLHILKHGRVSILRVVRKDCTPQQEFSAAFQKVYQSLPETIEIEVRTKSIAGDLLLLPEIMKQVPAKYKIKAVIHTVTYAVDVQYLDKNVGMDKFSEIPDVDYLGTSDKVFLKHYVENLGWEKCRSSIVQEKIVENMRREFYTGSNNRYTNKVPPMRPAPIQKLVDHYLESKLQFFSEQGVARAKNLNPSVTANSDNVPESFKLLYPSKTTSSGYRNNNKALIVKSGNKKGLKTGIPTTSFTSDGELSANEQEEDQTTELIRYQCKHIVQSAYKRYLDAQQAALDAQVREKPSTSLSRDRNKPAILKRRVSHMSESKSMMNFGPDETLHTKRLALDSSESATLMRRKVQFVNASPQKKAQSSNSFEGVLSKSSHHVPVVDTIVKVAPYRLTVSPPVNNGMQAQYFLPSVKQGSREQHQSHNSFKVDASFSLHTHQIDSTPQAVKTSVLTFAVHTSEPSDDSRWERGKYKPRPRSLSNVQFTSTH